MGLYQKDGEKERTREVEREIMERDRKTERVRDDRVILERERSMKSNGVKVASPLPLLAPVVDGSILGAGVALCLLDLSPISSRAMLPKCEPWRFH